jgi:hypothetical protein
MRKKKQTTPQFLFDEEIKNLKLTATSCTAFMVCVILGFFWGGSAGFSFMELWQFQIIVGLVLLLEIIIALNILHPQKIFLVKYYIFPIMVLSLTIGTVWVNSFWVASGFFLLVVTAGFFNSWKIASLTGILSLLSFIVLTFLIKPFALPIAILWLIFFIPLFFIVTFVTKRNHDFLYSLYNKNQEISEAKETLEIRVDARTKELKEVADTLEDKIKARTRELTEKISEMEKFQKIAIGRELKMVELKNEIERLKSQPPVVVEKIIEVPVPEKVQPVVATKQEPKKKILKEKTNAEPKRKRTKK